MKNGLTLLDLYPEIVNILKNGGTFKFTPSGNSMFPFLKDGENEVEIKSAENIKIGDVILVKTDDDFFLLHRVDEIRNGGFILRGDNLLKREGVFTEKNIIGKMVGYTKDGKYIDVNSKRVKRYLKYALPIHRFNLRIRRKLKMIVKGQKNVD